MEIHKPKAAHSWREFLIEIGTIVCGILIAIALEQSVEWLHWRESVTRAEEDLDAEVLRNLRYAAERSAMEPCYNARIREIAQRLQTGSGAWVGETDPNADAVHAPGFSANALGQIYRAPGRPWPTGSWDSTRASGLVSRMSLERQAEYSTLFRSIEIIRTYNEQEHSLTPRLQPLTFTHPIDSVQRVEMLSIIGQLASLNQDMGGVSNQFMGWADQVRLRLKKSDVDQRVAELRSRWGACVRTPPLTQMPPITR